MKFQILLFFILISFLSSHAQESEYFLQKHINGESGLPQNTVRDLHFSKTGFLWIATENGLSRFDGKNVRNYYASKNGLIKNRIGQFIAMNNGKLYCLAQGQYLHEIIESKHETFIPFIKLLNHQAFISYDSFESDSLEQFLKIVNIALPENVSFDGTIFLSLNTQKKVAQRTRAGITVYSSISCNAIKTIEIPESINTSYFVYNNELYCKLENNSFLHINTETGVLTPLKTKFKFSLQRSFNGNNMNQGLLIWNYKSKQPYFIDHNTMFEIRIHSDSIQFVKKITDLPPFRISKILLSPDRQSYLIGTFTNGFFWYKAKSFDIKLSNYGDNSFYAQTNSKNEASIFTPIPSQKFFLNRPPQILHDERINRITLLTDCYNRVWFARSDTVICKNVITNQVFTRFTIPQNNGDGIGVLAERDSNSIYVSSNRELFVYHFNSGLQKICKYPSQKPIERTFTLLKVNDSILYIGSDQGLLELNTKTTSVRLLCLKGIAVRSLFQTSNKLILAGTYGSGYFVIQNENAISIPIDKDENLKSTHCFIEDHHGYIWLTTNNGLFKVKLNEIEDYIKTKRNNILYYFRYSHSDGLLTNEFNGGCYPPSIQVDSSTWSLPSMRGLVWLKPDSLETNFGNSMLCIDKIILNDKLINFSANDLIKTKQHDFRLELFASAPNWNDDANLYIEYIIDPKNKNSEWKLLKDNNSPILLQNLSGGNHILKIRKYCGERNNLYNEISVTIQVPKVIHEYWWFWPMSILILIATIFGSIKLATFVVSRQKLMLEKMVNQKTIQLQEAVNVLEEKNITIKKSEESLSKENELKNTLLFLLSHDIASPLRFINMFLSGVAHSENMANMSKEDLVDLTISTQNLEALLNNIVAWIKQTLDTFTEIEMEEVQLQTLLQEKLNLFQLAIKKKNNQVVNELPVDLTLRTNQFILSMAFQNILGNAINYAKNGIIRIAYQETVSAYEISVIDSGNTKKRDQNEVLAGYGIGLKITNELLKMIDGEIKLDSIKNNEGMKATIYIRKK